MALSRRVLVRMSIVLAVFVTVAGVGVRPASATTTMNDPNDTAGSMDIKDASVVFDATNAVITMHTYESFTDTDGLVLATIDLDSDGFADKLLFVLPQPSGLQGLVLDNSPRSHVVPVVHNGATLTITIARTLLANATAMDFNLATANLNNDATDKVPDTTTVFGQVVPRIAGADRIETAVQSCFATDGAADGVVLSRTDGFADALAGSPLAAAKKGCLLLTPTGALDPRTLAEIQRVLPPNGNVYLLGGESALSADVANAVTAAGFNAIRLGGNNRYETAVKVATDGLGSPEVVLVATGNNFPDALGAGPGAAVREGAILLSDDSSLPPSTAAYLQQHPQATVFAIGGPAAEAVPSATPVVGVDRYDTSVKVATTFFEQISFAGVASGLNFPDALAGGAGMGGNQITITFGQGPMLLTPPDALPQVVSDYITNSGAGVVAVFGGAPIVHDEVVAQLHQLLGS